MTSLMAGKYSSRDGGYAKQVHSAVLRGGTVVIAVLLQGISSCA